MTTPDKSATKITFQIRGAFDASKLMRIVRGRIIGKSRNFIDMSGDHDILMQFGQRVRKLRKAKGFSQEAFAAHCGLDRTYIGGIERGERNVAMRNIEIIATALDVTISELTRGLGHRGGHG